MNNQDETVKQILFGKDGKRCLYPEDEDLPEILAALARLHKQQMLDVVKLSNQDLFDIWEDKDFTVDNYPAKINKLIVNRINDLYKEVE